MRAAERLAATPSVVPRPLRIAALGGGTGLPRVLAGFSAIGSDPERRPLDVTAIVTTADDGGSSGELRRHYGVPSPGDIRNCLVALSVGPGQLARLFQHRFEGEGALSGHAVGNLVLTALTQQLGDFGAAVRAAGELLGTRGRVLPATERSVGLVAMLDDGRIVRGESAIAAARGRVGRLALDGPAPSTPDVRSALAQAELVALGPGSLYSSVIASLLVGGVAEALAACRGERVLVMNVFTQPGETDGYDVADHVRGIVRHAGPVVDAVLVHARRLPPRLVETYAAQGSHPVQLDRAALRAAGVELIEADLLAPGGEAARHDGRKVAEVLLERLR